MIIPINEEIRIAGTERCWELQRIRNYKGGKRWEAYKWFATFRQALDEAVDAWIQFVISATGPDTPSDESDTG